jgi:hypothetical protein
MPPRAKRVSPPLPVPPGFRVARDLPVGRHPLLAAFPGLDRLPAAARLVEEETSRTALFDATCIYVTDQDVWMYVAPHEVPPGARREWKPYVSPGNDCIVVGQSHLKESSELMLFMDIFHELCHILQRRDGANLWEPGVSYVRRWTEIDAYRFVIEEARTLGVSNRFLREYLRVEWIDDADHAELLRELDVPHD